MALHIIDHPLVQHKLSIMRNKERSTWHLWTTTSTTRTTSSQAWAMLATVSSAHVSDTYYIYKRPSPSKSACFFAARLHTEKCVARKCITADILPHVCPTFDQVVQPGHQPPSDTIRKKRKPSRISSMVRLSIEISNRFVDNFERVIRFMTLGIKIRKRQSAALTTDYQ